jgi:hypothetical protein
VSDIEIINLLSCKDRKMRNEKFMFPRMLLLISSLCISGTSFAQRSGAQTSAPAPASNVIVPTAPQPAVPVARDAAPAVGNSAVAVPQPVVVARPVPEPIPKMTITPINPTQKPETIQEIATQSASQNQAGEVAAAAASIYCDVQAMQYCPNKYTQYQCMFYKAGAKLSDAAGSYMSQARGASNATAEAVTVPYWDDPNLRIEQTGQYATNPTDASGNLIASDFSKNPNGANTNVGSGGIPSGGGNPYGSTTAVDSFGKPVSIGGTANNADIKKAQEIGAKLEKEGWKIDPKTGKVVDPSGKIVDITPFSTPAQIKAAGLPSAITQDLLKSQAEMTALMDKKMKAAAAASAAGGANGLGLGGVDGGSLEGGPGALTAVGMAGAVGGGAFGRAGVYGAGQKFGFGGRDPAQLAGVAGMKKDYFGEPIGVSADSLFDMVDRRYQLHQRQGSFLGPR